MLNRTSDELTMDERQSAHTSYVESLVAGTMSGEEFVEQLQSVCGFSQIEARHEWQTVNDALKPAIYNVKCGEAVSVPTRNRFGHREWHSVRVVSHYGSGIGVIVKFESGLTVPYALFNCRLV